MTNFSKGRLKYRVNESFFDLWTSEMTYILGFTYADGNIYKNSLNWDIQKRDKELLVKINRALTSNYPIKEHRNKSVRLRISNQILVGGAIKRGLLPKKKIRNLLPTLQSELVRHFIRGYLDGDGWIFLRNTRNEVDVGFVNGNKGFLIDLNLLVKKSLGIIGKVREKHKVTPKGVFVTTYLLEYFASNAMNLIRWLYKDLTETDIYMKRKYMKYVLARELYDYLESGTRKVRFLQKRLGKSMKVILEEMYLTNKLDGVRIAEILGVHSSSVYRWLASTGIKYPERRKIYG